MSRELFFWHSVQSPFTFCRFPKQTKAALAECTKGSDNFFCLETHFGTKWEGPGKKVGRFIGVFRQ